MARNSYTVAHKRRKKRVMKAGKGFRALAGRYKAIKERLMRADAFAFAGRKQRKRQFRSLWVTRLNAVAGLHGLRYSQLIHGLKLAGIELNRKMVSEIAIHDPKQLELVMGLVKAALAKHAKAAA